MTPDPPVPPPAVPADMPWGRMAARRLPIDPAAYRGVAPSTQGTSELALGSVLTEPDGSVLLAYLPFQPVNETSLRLALRTIPITIKARTGGLASRTAVFGHTPRITVRREWCSQAAFVRDYPAAYALLAAQARPLEDLYETVAPGIFTHHTETAQRVLPDWRLPDSRVFTGGVVNRDSNLGYHHDAGNFRDVFSAMICLREGMAGGALVLPELGLHLPIADGTATFFDGQSLLHGVTAMRRTKRTGHRFTVVYYSSSRLWNCLPPPDEAARAQSVRTTRALRRAGLEQLPERDAAALRRRLERQGISPPD